MLRTIASDLRKEATRRDRVRREKAATILVAASGLGLLSRKLGVRHG
jgi:hypothetical protein